VVLGFLNGRGAVGFALGALLGALLGLGPRLALVRVGAGFPLHDVMFGELAGAPVGGLGALADPLGAPLHLQDDAVGVILLQQRVVGAHLFDEAAVARRMAVGDDDRIVGALLGAATGETDLQHSRWS